MDQFSLSDPICFLKEYNSSENKWEKIGQT